MELTQKGQKTRQILCHILMDRNLIFHMISLINDFELELKAS